MSEKSSAIWGRTVRDKVNGRNERSCLGGGGRRRRGDDGRDFHFDAPKRARWIVCIARWTKEIAIMHSSRIPCLSLSLFSVLVPENDKFPSHCPVPGTATFSANPSKVPSRGVVRVDRAETIDNPLDDRISRKPNDAPLFLPEIPLFKPLPPRDEDHLDRTRTAAIFICIRFL